MSFHGFQPHDKSGNGDAPSRRIRDDGSDSGYGGSVGGSVISDPEGAESSDRSALINDDRPDRATYQRGSSSITQHHRSPSGKSCCSL